MGQSLYQNSEQVYRYADIFSFDLAMEHPKNIGIKKHTIKLVEGKQPPYEPIYTLSLV